MLLATASNFAQYATDSIYYGSFFALISLSLSLLSGVLLSKLEIVTWIVTGALLLGMVVLIKRTSLGMQLRASTEDFRMAQLVGVRANWVISAAFGITGLLASAVALLFTFRSGAIAPDIGQGPLLIAFVGGVIGGPRR